MDPVIYGDKLHTVTRHRPDDGRKEVLLRASPSQDHLVEASTVRQTDLPGSLHLGVCDALRGRTAPSPEPDQEKGKEAGLQCEGQPPWMSEPIRTHAWISFRGSGSRHRLPRLERPHR